MIEFEVLGEMFERTLNTPALTEIYNPMSYTFNYSGYYRAGIFFGSHNVYGIVNDEIWHWLNEYKDGVKFVEKHKFCIMKPEIESWFILRWS